MLLAAKGLLLQLEVTLLTPKSNASGGGITYNVKNGEKFAHVKLKL